MACTVLGILAALCGISIHQGLFISDEWHMQAATILIGHLVALVVAGIPLFLVEGLPIQPLHALIVIAIGYLSGLFGSIVTYRLLFHQCRQFPGPLFAQVSKIWHVWHARSSQNHLLLEQLHHRYGDFVRTGPNEITVFDASAFTDVLGPGTLCTRTVWYDMLQPNLSIISTRSMQVHDERRRVWSLAFGSRALKSYEPRVLENIEKFVRYAANAASQGHSVDATGLCYWFTFDVMGEFAFSKSFGMLDSENYHNVVILLRRAFELLGPLSPVIWLIRLGFTLLPNVWRIRDWQQMLDYCHTCMQERLESSVDKADIATHLIRDAEKNGFTEQDRKFLNGDSMTVIFAGSDSTASTLTFVLYHLAKFPQHADTIFKELAGLDVCDSFALQGLPHLHSVIEETLRLFPVVPTGGQRQTPPEGISISGKHIPGNTVVVVPRYTIGRKNTYFEEADQFIPERWYSRPDLVKFNSAHVPFGLGKTSCIGKSLAWLNLKLVIARVVSEFHIDSDPNSNPDLVHQNMKDHFTLAPGPLRLKFRPRVKA